MSTHSFDHDNDTNSARHVRNDRSFEVAMGKICLARDEVPRKFRIDYFLIR